MHHRRPAIALVTAIAFWTPTLRGFLRGSIDLSSTAIRFLLAFLLAWIAVTVVMIIVSGYGGQPTGPRRRRTDHAGDAVPVQPTDVDPEFDT